MPGGGRSCWFFFFNDTATTEIYTLSLHDALPIRRSRVPARGGYTLPLDSPLERELLSGGNMAGEVVRVGRTVHRRAGLWTPAVHDLLRHVELVGFGGAPRALGT